MKNIKFRNNCLVVGWIFLGLLGLVIPYKAGLEITQNIPGIFIYSLYLLIFLFSIIQLITLFKYRITNIKNWFIVILSLLLSPYSIICFIFLEGLKNGSFHPK